MKIVNQNDLLEIAKKAAIEAGQAIQKVAQSVSFEISHKADHSPVTLADRQAHDIIARHLSQTAYPLLSEEGKHADYETRKNWANFWLVDPLDGTREFIKQNGEYTVNIAFISHQKPIIGVVYVPFSETLYYAIRGKGALRTDQNGGERLYTKKPSKDLLRIVASRSSLNTATKRFIAQQKNSELIQVGSSLKFMLIAEGRAHLYPRMGTTMEWDTAASQIIVEEAGGTVLKKDQNQALTYNKADLRNPNFIVRA